MDQTIDIPIRDIHLPEAISWWPLAIGWWIVIALVLCALMLLYVYITKLNKPTLKRKAKAKIASIEKKFVETQNPVLCVSEISMFFRQVVITDNNEKNVAGLTGQSWLEWLDKSLKEPEFSQGPGQLLINGPYQQNVNKNDVDQLLKLCHKWVNAL